MDSKYLESNLQRAASRATNPQLHPTRGLSGAWRVLQGPKQRQRKAQLQLPATSANPGRTGRRDSARIHQSPNGGHSGLASSLATTAISTAADPLSFIFGGSSSLSSYFTSFLSSSLVTTCVVSQHSQVQDLCHIHIILCIFLKIGKSREADSE